MESASYNLSQVTRTPNTPQSISHGPSQPPTCTLPNSRCNPVPKLSTSPSSNDDSAAWSYTPLSVQIIHQHDIHYSTLENDAAYKDEHSCAFELGLNSIGADLPSHVKDKVTENDIGRMYTDSAIPPCISLESATGYNTHIHLLVTESAIAHVNGHCHSYRSSPLVAHLGRAESETRPNSQASTEYKSLNLEPQYSSTHSVAGPKIADRGYDLTGIGSQFSGLEQEEHEF